MKFKKLKIKGFRGFNSEQEINLDADVILVYGLNGTGKSSFTEALEWLFFGDISRRKLSPCKSEYQYEDYLKNLFYKGTENPFVEIEGELNGTQIILKKELVSEKEVKCFLNGTEVSDFSGLPLSLESKSRPMLAQTEIAALVNTEQKDRWEQLSYILGQEDLTRLRQHLIELRNTKKDAQYKESEKEYNGIVIDLKKIGELKDLRDHFEQFDKKKILSFLNELIKKEGIDISPEDYDNGIKIKLDRILGSDIAKRVVDLKTGSLKEFNDWRGRVEDIFKELEDCIARIVKETVNFDMVDFLEKGKKLAKVPDCPFCKEKSLTKERLVQIDTEIDSADTVAKEREKCKELINKIYIDFNSNQIKESIKSILPPRQELQVIAQKLSDLDLKDLAGKLQNYEKEIKKTLDNSSSLFSTQISAYTKALENYYFHSDKSIIPATAKETLLKQFEETSKSLNSLLSKWPDIKEEIVKLFVLPSASTQKDEVEKWILIDKINSFVSREDLFFKKKHYLNLVDNIQAKLERYEKQQVEKLLTDHSEEIRDYYNRLNPDEKILFKKIVVKSGVRRQARLVAEAYGKEINPVTIFSEAHTNSLSLSIYFPQRVDELLSNLVYAS